MPDSLTYAKYSSKIKRSFFFFFFFHLSRQFYVEFRTFQIKYDYGLCYLYTWTLYPYPN